MTSALKEHKGSTRVTGGRREEQQTPVEAVRKKISFHNSFNLWSYYPVSKELLDIGGETMEQPTESNL